VAEAVPIELRAHVDLELGQRALDLFVREAAGMRDLDPGPEAPRPLPVLVSLREEARDATGGRAADLIIARYPAARRL